MAVEPSEVFPTLDRPPHAPLDALVFLMPASGGGLRVDPLPPDDVVTRVAHHVAYLDDVSFFALRAMFGAALPGRTPWILDTLLEARLARLPSLLAGVRGWAAQVPPDTPPAAVAAAIVEVLASG